MPRQAEIGDERDGHEGVAQQAHQDGRSAEPVEIFSLEDVNRPGHREGARGHGDPDEVEEDPEAPRIRVGEVRAAAESHREPRHHRDAAERHEQQQNPVERGQHLQGQALELHVVSAVARGRARDGQRPLAERSVERAEQGAERHDGGRHGPERRRGEPREGLLPERREPDLVEGDPGEVQHARPAELLLAVDVIDVPLGTIGLPLLRERQHLVASPVAKRVGGAGLDARGSHDGVDEALGLVFGGGRAVELDRDRLVRAVGAVRALLDLRRELVPLRGRHVPRARQHAVAAADALVDVVGDGTVRLPVQRRRRTGRDAAGLQAVEAAPHHEVGIEPARLLRIHVLVERDQRVRLGGERRRILESELGLQLRLFSLALVPLFAGHLAGAAADAVGDVDQGRPDRNRSRRSARRRHARLPVSARGAVALTTLTRQALVSWVPAPGSAASIVRWLTLGPVERPWNPQL